MIAKDPQPLTDNQKRELARMRMKWVLDDLKHVRRVYDGLEMDGHIEEMIADAEFFINRVEAYKT